MRLLRLSSSVSLMLCCRLAFTLNLPHRRMSPLQPLSPRPNLQQPTEIWHGHTFIAEAHRILSKLVTFRPNSVTSQGREAQITLSASMLEQSPLFAAVYLAYGLGDALADVTSSALLTQALVNVVLHLRPEVKGRKDEVVKTLAATKEVKEFQAVLPKVVDTLQSYKKSLKESGEKFDDVRSFGQPYFDDKLGVVHKRMEGQTHDAPVEWGAVATARFYAINALRKLGRRESNEVVEPLTNIARVFVVAACSSVDHSPHNAVGILHADANGFKS